MFKRSVYLSRLCMSLVSGVLLGGRYGAFALAMILSLAAAVPIIFVCKLPDCARKKNPLQSWGRASRVTD